MRIRKIFPILAVASLVFAPATQASAATKKNNVEVGGTNWFWKPQTFVKPSDVHGQTCPPGSPVPCPDPQRSLPNPHEEGALPVQVLQGQDEKIAAIQWDFSFLPTQGAKIHSFKFTIIESKDPRDQNQTVNAVDKIIQACKITDTWSGSEDGADRMEDKPDHSCTDAVDGERKGASATGFFWEFDISKIAASWTEETKAYGVMLVGKKPKDSTDNWQIVLKGPRRNDETTMNVDEAAANAANIKASVSYTPKAKASSSSSSSSSSSGFPGSTGTGDLGFSPDYGPTTPGSTDFAGSFPAPAAPVASAPTTGTPSASAASSARKDEGPQLPAIFWLMIPLSLMALSMVRSIVLEPAGGKRANGVVALIRNHNAARLGRTPMPDARSPFSGVTRVLQSAGGRVRGLVRRVITGGAS